MRVKQIHQVCPEVSQVVSSVDFRLGDMAGYGQDRQRMLFAWTAVGSNWRLHSIRPADRTRLSSPPKEHLHHLQPEKTTCIQTFYAIESIFVSIFTFVVFLFVPPIIGVVFRMLNRNSLPFYLCAISPDLPSKCRSSSCFSSNKGFQLLNLKLRLNFQH